MPLSMAWIVFLGMFASYFFTLNGTLFFLSRKNINVKSDIFGFKFQSATSNLDKFLNQHES